MSAVFGEKKYSQEMNPELIDLRVRFWRAATEISQIGHQAGCKIVPANHPRLPLFSSLSRENQQKVVGLLESSASVYRTLLEKNCDPRDSASVVWMAFKKLNLIPPSDFFDKFGADDVVQFYTKENFHLFVNFRFFSVCSYTLEQVYSLPWTDLWHRDESELTDLQSIIEHALGPDQTNTITFKKSPHRVVELASEGRFELNYSVKGIAPIWKRDPYRKVGFVIIERGELLHENLASRLESLREPAQGPAERAKDA